MLDSDGRTDRGMQPVNRHFIRLTLELIFLASFASSALADDPIAETVRKWGLLGPWSIDCALPPRFVNANFPLAEIVRPVLRFSVPLMLVSA